MTDTELRQQIVADVHELRFMASQYPRESAARLLFLGFISTIESNFHLSDSEKIELILQQLDSPIPKATLIERMDFSRDEARRLIDSAVRLGLLVSYGESNGGRPMSMVRLP